VLLRKMLELRSRSPPPIRWRPGSIVLSCAYTSFSTNQCEHIIVSMHDSSTQSEKRDFTGSPDPRLHVSDKNLVSCFRLKQRYSLLIVVSPHPQCSTERSKIPPFDSVLRYALLRLRSGHATKKQNLSRRVVLSPCKAEGVEQFNRVLFNIL